MESTDEFLQLKREYSKLLEKFQELQVEHDDLQMEYQENTIIQSMNDMKERYEQLMTSTVSLFKFNLLEKKFNELYRMASAGSVIIEHVKKQLTDLSGRMYSTSLTTDVLKVESHLNLLQEIMDECLRD